MRFFNVTTLIILVGLSFNNAIAAPAKQHSHNGRTHSHSLPVTGVKHFHKHMHNGRAHIHPYSAKIGFKHSHTRRKPKLKVSTNAVTHQHGGRSHSHPLPRSGVKHDHQHKHGGRSHIHPLPVNGAKHFHKSNPKNSRLVTNTQRQYQQQPRMITGLSIKQQMDAVLNTPIKGISRNPNQVIKNSTSTNSKPVSIKLLSGMPTSVINNSTINKVLAYGHHQHNGRKHQHALPTSGVNHQHKKMNTQYSTKKQVNKNRVIAKQNANNTIVPKQTLYKQIKARLNIDQKKTIKKTQIHRKIIKPFKPKTRQTPQQIVASNRQFSLALRYQNGTGVKQNLVQAVNWYLRSAKQGNTKAQFNLASMYENGDGVARNIPQAIHWYTTSANNGNVDAQVMMGDKYAKGQNVPRNTQKAIKWYSMAANQGDMRGRANLNYLTEE